MLLTIVQESFFETNWEICNLHWPYSILHNALYRSVLYIMQVLNNLASQSQSGSGNTSEYVL